MFVTVFLISLVLDEGRSLVIDDKLDHPFSSDCFKRISIGERLIAYDVTRTIERNQVKDCEVECNIHKCNFFSFGIGAAGNGTCELSTRRDISRRQDADYDIYQRTSECAQGKPTGYEEACYRKLIGGRRLNERYIRHSLPCDALQACQHQCSVEKHFQCHGFNVRLDKQNTGRGVCELTAVPSTYLDSNRDFLYDPEFDYYEKDHTNNSPNCGYINEVINVVPKHNAEIDVRQAPGTGGPYYGGDSYGPWSTGYGGSEHGPWGSHGYGSGYYVSNNPSRGPTPLFRPNAQYPGQHYGSGGEKPYRNYHPNEIPDYGPHPEKGRSFPLKPYYDNNERGKLPAYVIIEADDERNRRTFRNNYNDVGPHRPNYPPIRPNYPPDRPPNYGGHNNYIPPGRPSGGPPGGPFDHYNGGSYNDIGHEVCFQRAHPGHKLNPTCVRSMLEMPTLLDCEAMCMKAPFKCTGYSYMYTRPQDRQPNCALTDFTKLNPNVHLIPDRGCDVYFKMATCLDFNGYNDAECFSKVVSNQRMQPDVIRRGLNVHGISDCELECLKSNNFACRSFTFRYGPGVIGEPVENCFLSDWPISAIQPRQFVPSMGYEIYERGSFGHGCEINSGPPYIGPGPNDVDHPHDKYHGNREEIWKHFTVRGWPCRRGTTCQLNPEAGFWSCEVEGGDLAQWDYCCRPRHACGFSRGFNYPWCYVGEAGPDQWRPCSEQYYPDFRDRNQYPGYGDSYGPSNNRPWTYGQEEYGPPSYWPISYLYNEPPPNETDHWQQHVHHHHHHHDEDTPRIKFKPTSNKVAYPKATVQKLDVKDTHTAGDPGDELPSEEEEKSPDINPRVNYAKKLDASGKVPTTAAKHVFSTSGGNNCEKGNAKNEVEQFSSTTLAPFIISENSTIQFSNTKRQLSEKLQNVENVTENSISNNNKTKAVIQTIEKLIEDNSKENETVSEKMLETLDSKSAENIGFVSRFDDSRPKTEGDAMARFWNWSQEKYSLE